MERYRKTLKKFNSLFEKEGIDVGCSVTNVHVGKKRLIDCSREELIKIIMGQELERRRLVKKWCRLTGFFKGVSGKVQIKGEMKHKK